MQHEDPYVGLLSIRNTVNEGWHSSPTQRMFGRAAKTLLPTTANHLTQSSVSTRKDRDQANKRRTEEALRFDQHARDLKPLQVGTSVRIQPSALFSHTWKPGIITRQLSPRSYEVQTDEGTVIRRDRHFMRPSHEQSNQPDLTASHEESQTVRKQPAEKSAPSTDCINLPQTDITDNIMRRSGRISRPVKRLNL